MNRRREIVMRKGYVDKKISRKKARKLISRSLEVETFICGKKGGWSYGTFRRTENGWMALIHLQEIEAGSKKEFPVYSDTEILNSILYGVRIMDTN